jgi:hypothetical protein
MRFHSLYLLDKFFRWFIYLGIRRLSFRLDRKEFYITVLEVVHRVEKDDEAFYLVAYRSVVHQGKSSTMSPANSSGSLMAYDSIPSTSRTDSINEKDLRPPISPRHTLTRAPAV